MSESNKVLVLGAEGLLGSNLVTRLRLDGDWKDKLLISTEKFWDSSSIDSHLSRQQAGTVINCAGYKGEDCYKHLWVHGCLPRAVADWCQKRNALLIHISTNAVFAANSDRLWDPEDSLKPQNSYEVAKVFGEDPRAYVIRASFIGRRIPSKPGKQSLYERLESGQPYYNKKWNGVTALALAERILEIVKIYHGRCIGQLEHLYSAKVCSFSEIAKMIGSRSRCLGAAYDGRLLGGGIQLDPLDAQIKKYQSFLNDHSL